MNAQNDGRRWDVDALRTLALGLLILYHLGMYYVLDWGWHVKSPNQQAWLQDVMILSNQWRMSLLFFVSGMTLALVSARFSAVKLLKERGLRLGIPLLFGMLVIVPPQLFFELIHSGHFEGSYLAFYREYLDVDTALAEHKQSEIGLLTWNHLWFMPYLLVYSCLWLLLRAMLPQMAAVVCRKVPAWLFYLSAVGTLFTVWFFLRQTYPSTHDLINDWYNHGKYLTAFGFGSLMVVSQRWWKHVIDARYWLLGVGVVCYSLLIADRHGAFPELAGQFTESDIVRAAYGLVATTNLWAWLLAMVGLAGHFLNRPFAWLQRANHAVLPIYILHQSVIIVLAMWLLPLALPAWAEAPLILLLTGLVCGLGYWLICRFNILKLLFGIKINHSAKTCDPQEGRYTEKLVSQISNR